MESLPVARWIRRRRAWSVFVPLGVLLIALSARVDVPMVPVPMSLQTLAVLSIAALYGSRLGTATVAIYIGAAAVGLPVLAGGAGGWSHVVGPTAGYLVGFLAAAWLVGRLAESGFLGRGMAHAFAAMLLGHAVILALGVARLSRLPDYDFGMAVDFGATPFLAGAVVKSALATLVVIGAGRLVATRSQGRTRS